MSELMQWIGENLPLCLKVSWNKKAVKHKLFNAVILKFWLVRCDWQKAKSTPDNSYMKSREYKRFVKTIK